MSEERRIVTVLFADVAGSTALGEELDPEEMRRLLARYYSVAREVVGDHGGTVEKFIGDAVMAVFGLPTAHGDDPDRPVAAALTMRQQMPAAAQPELSGSRRRHQIWLLGCSRPVSRGRSSPAIARRGPLPKHSSSALRSRLLPRASRYLLLRARCWAHARRWHETVCGCHWSGAKTTSSSCSWSRAEPSRNAGRHWSA